jgi:hypothetical protein
MGQLEALVRRIKERDAAAARARAGGRFQPLAQDDEDEEDEEGVLDAAAERLERLQGLLALVDPRCVGGRSCWALA